MTTIELDNTESIGGTIDVDPESIEKVEIIKHQGRVTGYDVHVKTGHVLPVAPFGRNQKNLSKWFK